jgi:hypothetical protein
MLVTLRRKNEISMAKTVVIFAESPYALFCVNVFRNYIVSTWFVIF